MAIMQMLKAEVFRFISVDPQKYKGMAMEKIEIGKCLSELPVGDANRIVGTSGVNGVLTTPGEIAEKGGCGAFLLGTLSNGKWYRVALGKHGGTVSTALINIGKSFTNSSPSSQLLYVSAYGYSFTQVIESLAGSEKSISKARILYKNSTTDVVMLDIYINSLLDNNFFIGYSNNIGFTFQSAVEVPATPDAGYLVKEFTF